MGLIELIPSPPHLLSSELCMIILEPHPWVRRRDPKLTLSTGIGKSIFRTRMGFLKPGVAGVAAAVRLHHVRAVARRILKGQEILLLVRIRFGDL